MSQNINFEDDRNMTDSNIEPVHSAGEFENSNLADSSVAVAGEQTEVDQSATEDCCEKCEATGQFQSGISWCKQCGYYPMLGTFLEVDPQDELFEKEQPQGNPLDESEAAAEPKATTTETYLEFLKSLPLWVWIILAGQLGLLALSITIHLVSPAVNSFRMIWALSQIAIGLTTFLFVHFRSYVYEAVESDKLGFADMLNRPITVWKSTFRDIKTQWQRVAIAIWSITAVLFAMMIIGGIPYHKIWEVGPEKSAKKNLIKAITENIERGEGNVEDLADSIEEFAGTPGEGENNETPVAKEQITIECVVIGYTSRIVEGEIVDGFRSLLLANVSGGELKYAGTVSGPFDKETREKINSQLIKLAKPRPYVPCQRTANWLRPTITCEVLCTGVNKNNTLRESSFKKLLSKIELP